MKKITLISILTFTLFSLQLDAQSECSNATSLLVPCGGAITISGSTVGESSSTEGFCGTGNDGGRGVLVFYYRRWKSLECVYM
ncbi:MAG: hypothetical protein COA33_003285 [Fluviicola sp.]|nr:hypothetical protein [Fluviicola sp.]